MTGISRSMATARQPPRSTCAATGPNRPKSSKPELRCRAARNTATAPATLPEAAQTIPHPVPNSIPATIARSVRGTNSRLAAMWTARKPNGAVG